MDVVDAGEPNDGAAARRCRHPRESEEDRGRGRRRPHRTRAGGGENRGDAAMNDNIRILVTGFGPFPGAPFNPTMPLVKRLTELRRPAFSHVELTGHIFHVTYATVD